MHKHQHTKWTPKTRVELESNTKGKNTERDFSTLSPIVQCYNCQDYGHVVANCPSLVRVIDKSPVTKLEFV